MLVDQSPTMLLYRDLYEYVNFLGDLNICKFQVWRTAPKLGFELSRQDRLPQNDSLWRSPGEILTT